MQRCREEIEAARLALLSGHPDIDGLLLAHSDWQFELKILEGMQAHG